MISFGEFLREKRTNRDPKISMRELARRTNVDSSYISRIEKNEYIPSRQVVMSIASALNENVDEFLLAAGYIDKVIYDSYIKKGKIADEIIEFLIAKGVIKEGEELTAEKKEWLLNLLDKAIDMSRM